jgi:hypothetical protein
VGRVLSRRDSLHENPTPISCKEFQIGFGAGIQKTRLFDGKGADSLHTEKKCRDTLLIEEQAYAALMRDLHQECQISKRPCFVTAVCFASTLRELRNRLAFRPMARHNFLGA